MKLPPNENLHSEVQLRSLLSEIPSRRSGYGQSNHKVPSGLFSDYQTTTIPRVCPSCSNS